MSGGFLLLIIFVPTVWGIKLSWNGRPEDDSVHTDMVTTSTTTEDPVNSTVIEKFAPKFSQPSKMYNLDMKPVGSSIRFKCKAEGSPTPNITWYKDDKPITRPFGPTYAKWSVRFDELMKTDAGNYTCVVCNELGCINHTIKLHVQERYPSKPMFKEPLRNITASWNDTVSFSCNIITDLEPYIEWSWRSPNTTEERIIQIDYNKSDILTIHNVSANSEGWYKCTAMNSLGNDSSEAYLQVVEKEIKEDIQQVASSNRFTTIFVIAMVMISVSITIIATKKFYQEKNKKKRAREATQHLMEEQWSKLIKVEHILKDNVLIPDVTIERVRYTGVSNIALSKEYILPVDMKWELPKARLTLGEVLGQDIHSEEDMIALMSEMEIMKLIGHHENIVNLLGCCSQDGVLWVVMEYAHHGCLLNYLHKRKPDLKSTNEDPGMQLTPKDMVEFALQVAKGMEFLASRGCIHRDLAARNVLVSSQRVLKVADFGLARDVRGSDIYHKSTVGKLPLKWMAPESIVHNLYTTQSDVWSFGILVWEIMSYGGMPYRNVSVHNIVAHLKSGGRLEKPYGSSQEIDTLMQLCWDFTPQNRPHFSTLVMNLEQILSRFQN